MPPHRRHSLAATPQKRSFTLINSNDIVELPFHVSLKVLQTSYNFVEKNVKQLDNVSASFTFWKHEKLKRMRKVPTCLTSRRWNGSSSNSGSPGPMECRGFSQGRIYTEVKAGVKQWRFFTGRQ